MNRSLGFPVILTLALMTGCSGSTGSSPNPPPSPTPSASATPTSTPSITPAPTASALPKVSPSPSSSPSPTPTPTNIPVGGGNPTASPSAAATATATASSAPTPAAVSNSCSETQFESSVRFVCTNDLQNDVGTVQNTYLDDYYGDNTDTGNSAAPFATQFYYQSAAPGLNPPGSVIASGSSVLTDSPDPITSTGDSIGFGFAQQYTANGAQPITSSGESFTCTLYDNTTLVGTAQATVYSSTSNGVTTNELACFADYNETESPITGNAYITLSNGNYNPGDTYTMVLSH